MVICSICFQVFQKDDIDPLQTQLQDINSLGQGLIQSAAKGTSTKKLEDDLEGVNTKWNTLNKKVIYYILLFWLADVCFWLLVKIQRCIVIQSCYLSCLFTMRSADCWTFSPAPWSPVALWEVPGCFGVPAQLVDWHRGACGQSKASLRRVQSGQGTDTRAESKPTSHGTTT